MAQHFSKNASCPTVCWYCCWKLHSWIDQVCRAGHGTAQGWKRCLFIIYLKLSYSLFCLFLCLVLLNRAVDRYRLLADLDEWLLHRGCKTLRFVSSPGLSHPSALRWRKGSRRDSRKYSNTSLSSCWWILKRKSQKYLQVTFTIHLTVTSNCW